MHVAIDRASFKAYIPFESYVLTLADQHRVPVCGLGTVEFTIRRQPVSKDSHTIVLENVLNVPSWLCNIFSDVFFHPANSYLHNWTEFAVSFVKKKDGGSLRRWRFTEEFCGLERLVLAKGRKGRSPMLEDTEREVFSVNVTWPQGQWDQWEARASGELEEERGVALKEVEGNKIIKSMKSKIKAEA